MPVFCVIVTISRLATLIVPDSVNGSQPGDEIIAVIQCTVGDDLRAGFE